MGDGDFLVCNSKKPKAHLDEEKRLQEEVEQHVGDDLADAGEGVRLPARDFER